MPSDKLTRSVLRVSGADASVFLQGQLCNDLEAVTPTAGQLSALSSPKGRVIAVFRILRAGDGYLLTLPAELAADVLTILRRYVLRSAVTLEVDPDGLRALTCDVLPEGLNEPATVYACTRAAGMVAMRLPGSANMFELVASTDALASAAVQPDATHIARAEVAAGLPDVGTANSGAFVAQMLNLDRLGGISFTKGCYTGQEVIARTQNLGRIKRRMLRFAGNGGASLPAAGDMLVIDGGSDAAGKVVSVAPGGNAGFELLAVMRLDAMDTATVTLADGTPLSPVEFD